jgi:hypothetical protein
MIALSPRFIDALSSSKSRRIAVPAPLSSPLICGLPLPANPPIDGTCQSHRCTVNIKSSTFMDQASTTPQSRGRGGNTRTPRAKIQTAQREEQIVGLRLRHVSFSAIARQLGISKSNAVRGFERALRRNTRVNIEDYQRSELAELDAEQASIWSTIAEENATWKVKFAGMYRLNRIHIRRADRIPRLTPAISGVGSQA